MNYKLINKTKISTNLLKELINFSLPCNIDNFKIEFKYMSNGAFMGKSIDNIITIYIHRKPIFPCYNISEEIKKFGYGKPIILYTLNEILLSLISHELRHVWQNQTNFHKTMKQSKLYVFVHRGNIYTSNSAIEKDATKYSKKIINKYRKCQ
jgi:hypothetical protein